MRKSRILAGALVIAFTIGAAWLLTRADDPTRPDADGVLTITMENYAFSPDEWRVRAGEMVTFRFINNDEVTHHVSMGRGLIEADGRAVAFETDVLDGLEVQVAPASAQVELAPPYQGFTVEVRGGATVDMATTFSDDTVGDWHIGCFTGRGCHMRAGLDGILTIEPGR